MLYQNELYKRIEASFLRQGMMQNLGVSLLQVEPGMWVRWPTLQAVMRL